jgi:hypothetical protein
MATSPITNTGPIGIEQINTTFYVYGGGIGFSTIQAAVNFIRTYNNSLGQVIICHGYTYAENIEAITGGSLSIVITDIRDGNHISYQWNGTAYVPSDFVQYGSFVARSQRPPIADIEGALFMGFDPTGSNNYEAGVGTGNLIVSANPGATVPNFQIQAQRSDGGAIYTFMRCDLDAVGAFRTVMPQMLQLTNDAGNANLWIGHDRDTAGNQGLMVTATPTLNSIEFQTETVDGTFCPTIALNRECGDLVLGQNGTLTQAGDLTVNGIDAQAAMFDTCLVANSPVRTFANTGDPSTGMQFPPAGIGVSTGTAWDDDSIDPETIAYLGTTNNFTMPQRVQTSTVVVQTDTLDTVHPNARLISQNMASTAIRGGFQFDGFSSDISQQGTYLMMWQDTNGLHSSFPNSGLDVNGILRTTYNAFAGANTGTEGGVQLTWNVSAASGETDFINNSQGAAGGFRWYNGPSNMPVNSSSTPMMQLDNPGNLTIQGSIDTMGQASYIQAGNVGVPGTAGQLITRFVAVVSGQAGVSYAGQFNIGTYSSTTPASSIGDTLEITHLSGGPDGPSGPLLELNRAATLTIAANQLRIGARQTGGWNTGTPNINCDGNSIVINPLGGQFVYFNWDMPGLVVFGNGAGSLVASIDTVGNGTFNAGVYAQQTLGVGVPVSGSQRQFSVDIAGGTTARFVSVNASSPSLAGDFVFYGYSSNFSQAVEYLSMYHDASTGFNAVFNATLNVNGTKNFRITHPLDDTKFLTHSSLEGPEATVYYRGETMTVDGWTEITLPDYFEALTLPDDRTVQLTQIFEDDSEAIVGTNTFSRLMASRVKNGKFQIRSSEPMAKIYWQVMAIRSDVPKLEVVSLKPTPPRRGPLPYAGPEAIPRTERAGVSEAGEHEPEASSSPVAANTGERRTRKPAKGA